MVDRSDDLCPGSAGKALGYQPHLAWADVLGLAFTSDHCYLPEGKDRWVVESVELLREQEVDGHPFRQFQTRLGKLWANERSADALAWLVWEIAVYGAYERPGMEVRAGDVVMAAARFALEGTQETIERFKPRLAICNYHLADDPEVVPTLALQAYPDYQIQAKGIAIDQGRVQPKVLLFN